METWNLYDENRLMLNKTHKRGESMCENEYHIVVGIWIVNSKKEILLTRRHPCKKTYPNYWENTGGSVLRGETSIEAAIRELEEEIGIKILENDLELMGTLKEDNKFIDEYLLKLDIDISKLVFQKEEVIDAKWVSYDTLIQMIRDNQLAEPIIDRFWPFENKINDLYQLIDI